MNKTNVKQKKELLISFYNDDIIVDTLLIDDKTNFIIFDRKSNSFSMKKFININGTDFYPINPNSNFLTSGSILFPSHLSEYGTKDDLLKDINDYLYKYIDIPDDFRIISTYYVILTYIYDNFSEIPYLRVIGDYGSGKSRLLKTIGSICFIPMITNGGTSLSAIFRMIEKFKGTLVIDEADINYSDTSNEMIKLFNNGFQKGSPIMRADGEGFEPRCYNVYCPKIIGGRMEFNDKATESRCLSNVMKKSNRKDIPIGLDSDFYKEGLILRNKLLKFRHDNFYNIILKNEIIDGIEARLNQIINPILSLVDKKDIEELIIENLKNKQKDIKDDRKNSMFGGILEYLRNNFMGKNDIPFQDIINQLDTIEGRHYINGRKLGNILKQNGLKSLRKNNGTVLPYMENMNVLTKLYEEYGIV